MLRGRTIPCKPHDGVMNLRDPEGTGDFDENNPGEIQVVNTSLEVNEDNGTVTISVSRSGGTGAASVDYATQDGTGAAGTDYTSASGTLSWADGETGSKSVDVTIIDRDGVTQGNTDFDFKLSNASGASLAEDEAGNLLDTTTVTILDQDTADPGTANIIYSGDWETGDYSQWPGTDGTPLTNHVGNLPFRPPEELGGYADNDGKHGTLVTATGDGVYEAGEVRSGTYAAKFRLPNQSDADTEFGAEGLSADPDDGDYNDPAGGAYNKRRTEVRANEAMRAGNGINEGQTRWFSVSQYIPSDWDLTDHGGFGPILMQVKPDNDATPAFELILHASWEIIWRWSDVLDPAHSDILWQWEAVYQATTASSRTELEDDYPDATASKNALGSVNRGGWTDWIVKIHADPRSNDTQGTFFDSGGQGSIEIWKREDAGAWVKVVDAGPRALTVGSQTFSRGVWTRDSNERFYLRTGFYGSDDQILNADPSRIYYNDNLRVYSGDSTFDGIVGTLT